MGTIAYIDHLLRNREQVIADLQDSAKVGQVTKTCSKVFVTLTVLYGLIMGSQSLMHGHASGWMYSLTAATKLPLLFLLTLAICIPLMYVLNVLMGPREQFKVIFGVLMSSLAVTSILLAACALILGFFMLSTKSYAFITLLNVLIFSIAGLYGVWFLAKGMHAIAAAQTSIENQPNVKTIINWWLITYGIVGTQMAWMMRPFIGHPGTPFSIFRPQESNFYITVGSLFLKMLNGG
jgi:hypothetical protein